MPAMHYVEFSPLWRGQRAQNWMVEHVDPAAEARFTLRDDRVHGLDFCSEVISHVSLATSLSALPLQVL